MSGIMVSDDRKQEIWSAYANHKPLRVPVRLSTNPRIVLLDPAVNLNGYTFEQAAKDPYVHVRVNLEHQLYVRTVLNQFTDGPTSLPERWTVGLAVYNVYEAAFLGAEVRYPPEQVPDTEPFLTDATKHAIFEVDIANPLDSPFAKDRLTFWREMRKVCDGMTFEGRPVELAPWTSLGTDGPLTVACNVRGAGEFLTDMIEDEAYADRLLDFVTRAVIERRRAFREYWDKDMAMPASCADDSCALISEPMYRQRILRHHRRIYESGDPVGVRSMHMCGDATHLFPTLTSELRVRSFDTGFPVNHGKLRRELGDNVEIFGGPEVALLLSGTPDEVFTRTRDILQSGVMKGGRFILREGNNLPPCCPLTNLQALYEACLAYGRYDT